MNIEECRKVAEHAIKKGWIKHNTDQRRTADWALRQLNREYTRNQREKRAKQNHEHKIESQTAGRS